MKNAAAIALILCCASRVVERARGAERAGVAARGETIEDPAVAREQAPDDAQDLIFMGPLRPVWMRLRVTIDGKPFRVIWRANVDRLFSEADANGDDLVDLVPAKAAEAEAGKGSADAAKAKQEEPSDDEPADVAKPAAANQPPADTVERLALAAAVYLGQEVGQARAGLAELAQQHEGKLSRQAFTDYFQRAAPPFTVAVGLGRTTAGQALFPLLDVNGDRQLTAEELSAAEEKLRIRDFNDDESLTQGELADAPNASLAAAAETADAGRTDRLPTAGPIVLVSADADPAAICETIVARYDRDGDGAVSTSGERPEALPTAEQFERLHAPAGEAIGGAHWTRFLQGMPDVDFKVELGAVTSSSRASPFRRLRPKADDAAAGPARLKKLADGSWEVALDDAGIALRRNNRDPSKNADNGPRLRNFDADNNGYLERSELAGMPELAADFDTIDSDGDGKIFGTELTAYTDRQNRAASARLLLEVFDQGQELFSQLDVNHDYRLSIRELLSATDCLGRIDADRDGRLSPNEIPQQLRLDLSRNTAVAAQAARRTINRDDRGRAATKQGPTWFQKMDRNDDGVVSPREFLGPAAIFSQLDTDGNRVLDAKEAAAGGKK
jgi:hypothetical protein